MYLPFAASTPVFLALAAPSFFSFRIRWILAAVSPGRSSSVFSITSQE